MKGSIQNKNHLSLMIIVYKHPNLILTYHYHVYALI